MLTFPFIPGFVGRMAVVVLVGLGVVGGLIRAGLLRLGSGGVAEGGWDWVLCAGVYGGVMAIVAGVIA
jgi:hypothetical protein